MGALKSVINKFKVIFLRFKYYLIPYINLVEVFSDETLKRLRVLLKYADEVKGFYNRNRDWTSLYCLINDLKVVFNV